MTKPLGLGQKSREQLGKVLKASPGAISTAIAVEALNLPRTRVAQLLGKWVRQGWLIRVSRGIYFPVPLEAETTEIAISEPWQLAHALFSPCYIGGWSAAEHWDLTEQIFHSIVVITTKKVHKRDLHLKGIRFKVKTALPRNLFGLKPVWIANQKISISDPSRTILDFFNDPSLGGGIRSVMDIFLNYMRSKQKDLPLLLQYADTFGKGAVYKRLGFILEREYPSEKVAIEECRKKIRSGYSQLDPQNPSKVLVTSWNLWVPTALLSKKESA